MNNPYQNPQHRPPQLINQPPNQPQQFFEQRGPSTPNVNANYKAQVSSNQYPVSQPNQQMGNVNVNHQAQLFQQYANSTNPQYGKPQMQNPQGYSENHQAHFPPPYPQSPPTGLMPPPQLRQQRDQDDTINPSKASNLMNQSNQNQNENENEVRDILWGEQQQASAFWEQKFFLIYQKFEWFGSRFQMLKSEYISLSEQLLTVDSEEDWNELKLHHQQFAQKLQEMFQQLIAVADQNQQLINQRLQQDDGVWQRRYHELLSNFKALQQKSANLQLQNQDMKSVQQNEQAQQQNQHNYPQLLTHYNNLQEEYQKLYNAYNKLQEQYQVVKSTSDNSNKGPSLEDFENMRIQYQRTLEGIHGENDQLKAECQGFYQENQQLREQLQMQAQAYGQTEHLSKTIHEKELLAMNLNGQLQEWKRNYQSLQSQLDQLVQRQSTKAQQVILQLQNQMQILRQEAKTKESQYVIVAKKLQDQLAARQRLIQDHHQQLSRALKLQNDKHLRQRQALQKEIKTLHQEYESMLKQTSEKDLSKYQIQAQQKRVSFLKDQNQQLIQQIRSKNQQLSALRNVSLQVSTYQNILDQYKALQKEKLSLEQTSRRQHSQLLQMKKKLNEVEHEFTQFRSITSSSSLRSATSSQLKQLQTQLSQQQQHSSRLQSQVHKLKQLISSKQSYINDLQEQNTKNMIKLQYQQRMIQGSSQDHQSQVTQLQKRIETLEKRNKSSELQFRKEIVQNYQREIKQLRLSNQDKLKKIKRLQEQLHDITTKSTHLQRYSSSHNNQLNMLHNKLTTLQTNNTQLLSKLTLARSSIQALEQQLSSTKDKETSLRTQLNSYTVQIQQADNLIKSKNNIIVQYQNQVNDFVEKITLLEGRIDGEKKEKFERIKKYQEEIEKLKDRLYNPTSSNTESKRQSFGHQRYSSSYNNRYLTFGSKQPPAQQRNQEITRIQTTIIEQMNQENSKLREEVLQLTKKVNSLESLSRVVAHMQQQQSSPKKSQSASRINVPALRDTGSLNTYLQERLLKFNQRLQHCIHDNQLIAERDVDLTASQRIANHQREKRQMQINYEKQVRALKEQVNSLTQQLNAVAQSASAQPQQQQLMDSDIKEFDKYNIMNEQAQKSTQQQIEFLRSKLNAQQKTNSVLIKLNQHLKKQLEDSFQKSSQSTTQYYKLQWKQSQKSLQEEKQKNKKIADQNKRLKHQNLEHDTKLMKQYELKLFNTELQLKQLQRENTYFRMLKTKSDNQKANLLHDVNVYSADIQTIKSNSENKVYQYEKITSDLRQKCNTLERELYQVNNSKQLVANNHVNSRLTLSNDKMRFSSSSRRIAV